MASLGKLKTSHLAGRVNWQGLHGISHQILIFSVTFFSCFFPLGLLFHRLIASLIFFSGHDKFLLVQSGPGGPTKSNKDANGMAGWMDTLGFSVNICFSVSFWYGA